MGAQGVSRIYGFSISVTGVVCSSDLLFLLFFFFNDTATTEIYTLSLHDALPISDRGGWVALAYGVRRGLGPLKYAKRVTFLIDPKEIGRAHV